MKVKLLSLPPYPKIINVTPGTFAKKIAKAIDDIKSSHCYFIMQQAYGEISWEEAQKILDAVLKLSK